MKVEYRSLIKVNDITTGDVFDFNGSLYQKLNSQTSKYMILCSKIETGDIHYFNPNLPVLPVEVKITAASYGN